MKDYIFVEIDMRNDFSDDPRAVLPVPGMLGTVGKMAALEQHAKKVVIAADTHAEDDPISQKEFEEFGPHCVPGTWGWDRVLGLPPELDTVFEVQKNTYDTWEGMGEDDSKLLMFLGEEDPIVVGGVVTGICVRAFIEGAIKRGLTKRVILITDCVANLDIKGMPTSRVLFREWSHQGIVISSYESFVKQYIMKD